MRSFPLFAAAGLAGMLVACASPGPIPPPDAPPPPGFAVETAIGVARDGVAFASLERTLWRERDTRFELDGPGVLAGEADSGLEISLRPDFNHAGEFWGELTIAEFDVLEDGTRVHYLGMPYHFKLDPSVRGWWDVEVPGRSGSYVVRVQMDYSAAFKQFLWLRM
ncbi:MAG: hypothetical protein O3A20_00060 [Planctomycetota bacterium]|nr:hypothetical protein [Planctomycetota bacterium]